MTAKPGTVYLVGAGPGDPGLLTRRGAAVLRQADLVFYDRLAPPALLRLAPRSAELIDVGKAPGRAAIKQNQINARLVAAACLGKIVVRLKGGDPFVFGRGGEESEACAAAGIPCRVVPGVSSAIAVPAAAGIPVTMRDMARSFAVVTARGSDGKAATLNFAALAGIDTVVFLMCGGLLNEIAAGLIGAGRVATTPAAIIEHGTLPDQRVASGSLETIAEISARSEIDSPALLIVGPTVALARTDNGAARQGRQLQSSRSRRKNAGQSKLAKGAHA